MHNTHWLNSKDGECEEIINLRYKDGSWHDIGSKSTHWTYLHGCDLIHYHPLDETESSTGDDTTFFYIGYREKVNTTKKLFSHGDIGVAPANTVTFGSNHGFGENGETVELQFTKGTSRIEGLTDGALYHAVITSSKIITLTDGNMISQGIGHDHGFRKVIGDELIAFLPNDNYEKRILFLDGEEITGITHLNNILIVNTTENVYFILWNYDSLEYVIMEHPVLPALSISYKEEGDMFKTEITGEPGIEFDYPDAYSKTSDFVSNSKKENNITESYVLVSVAYRLFDGSFIMHSQPIIAYIGRQQANRYHTVHTNNQQEPTSWDKGYQDIYTGKPVLKLITNPTVVNLAEQWKDVISGLTVFMTRPTSFFSFPQSEEGYTWKFHSQIDYPDGLNVQYIKHYMPNTKNLKDLVDDPVYYRVNEMPWDELMKSPSLKSIELGFNSDNIKQDFSYYQPNDSFTHHRLLSNIQYVFNRRLHLADVTTVFGPVDTQLLTDPAFQDTVEGEGFTPVSTAYMLPDLEFYVEVSLRTGSGNRYILQSFVPKIYAWPSTYYDPGQGNEGSGSGSWAVSVSGSVLEGYGPLAPGGDPYFVMPLMPIISYPDPRAFYMRILIKDKQTGLYYTLFNMTLKAHPFMTMAYYANFTKIYTEWTSLGEEDPEYYGYMHTLLSVANSSPAGLHQTTPQTDSRYYKDENRLQVSRIDNPFVNEAKHSYQVGGQDSKILGLATSSVQVSDGQFGEFPLFIFTNEGVYTLRQGVDPAILYSSISPVSKERLIPGTLCEIGDGIIYCTVDGVKLLSGTTVKNISESILLNSDNLLFNNTDYKLLMKGLDRAIVNLYPYLDAADFKRYLNGVKIAYDSYEGEVILCNPSYQYSYIYNLRADAWFKSLSTWDSFIMIQPKYYGVKEDHLEDLEQENKNEDKSVLIQTKPIKLGSQGFKSVSRIVVRQHLIEGVAEQSTSDSGSGSNVQPTNEIEGIYLFGSGDGTEYKLIRGVNVDKSISKHGIHRIVIPMSNVSLRYMIIVLVAKTTNFDFSHLEFSYFHKMQNKLR